MNEAVRWLRVKEAHGLDDALVHVRERPGVLGDDIEVLRSPLPLPGGEEIPMFALSGGGIATLVEAVVSFNAAEAGRIARSVSWLRREGEYIVRLFPDRAVRCIDGPVLLVLAPRYDGRFADTLRGLALSRVAWMRICRVRTVEGENAVLWEREKEWNRDNERVVSPDDLDEREAAFFRELEGELSVIRNRGGTR